MITPKRQRFVEEYLVDFNGTRAAIRAGYSPRTADVQAYDLLRNPQVQTFVEQGKARQSTHLGLTRERVLNEIRRIATADIGECFDENGRLRPMKSLDPDTRAALASIKILKTNIVSGDGSREEVHEIKLWDKLKALELAAKHLGMLDETVKHEGAVELVVSWKMPPSAASEQVIDVTPCVISDTVKEGE